MHAQTVFTRHSISSPSCLLAIMKIWVYLMSELQGITGAQNAAKILSSKAEDFVNDVSTSYLTVTVSMVAELHVYINH